MAKTTKPTTSRSAKTTGARPSKTVAPAENSEADAPAMPSRAKAGGKRAKPKAAARKRTKKPTSATKSKPDTVEPPTDPKPDAPDRVKPTEAAVGTATGAKAVTAADDEQAPAARPDASPRERKQPTARPKKSGAPRSSQRTAKTPARPSSRADAKMEAPTAPKRAPRQPRRGLPDPGFASPYRRRLYQLHEWLWRGDGGACERLPTQGVVSLDDLTLPKTRLVEAYPDRSSPARLVDWAIDALPMRPERLTFIDLGSGRGRVLMEAAKFPFQEVIGVEVTRELHETALMNLRHWPRWRLACRNITLVNGDVSQFDLPRRNIVLYMFRPFTERLMMAMARKATAVARAGHDVFVIVVDPKHALPFIESPIFDALTPSTSVRRRLKWRSPYSVAFFRATLP